MSDKVNDGGLAFPSTDQYFPADKNQDSRSGMSVRTWLAGMAMQGALSNPSLVDQLGQNSIEWLSHSVKVADALIKELGL